MASARPFAVTFRESDAGDVRAPLGYGSSSSAAAIRDGSNQMSLAKKAELKLKKAKEVALTPGKSIMMTMFMLWMSGSTVHIFSIMMTGMAMMTPIRGLMSVNATFAPFQDEHISLLSPKAVFIALHGVGLALGVYKLNSLGLLPTSDSDWVAYLPVKQSMQTAVGGLSWQ